MSDINIKDICISSGIMVYILFKSLPNRDSCTCKLLLVRLMYLLIIFVNIRIKNEKYWIKKKIIIKNV